MTSTLVATFSNNPGGSAMIAISPTVDSWDAIATSYPSASDNPQGALKAMGYRLAYPAQASTSLRPTMADTSYAKLHVLPI